VDQKTAGNGRNSGTSCDESLSVIDLLEPDQFVARQRQHTKQGSDQE
jgi:hypothetical protein